MSEARGRSTNRTRICCTVIRMLKYFRFLAFGCKCQEIFNIYIRG